MSIRDAKKEYVVEVAAKAFLESSVEAVTIRDIAQKAEVGEATVYRYFSGKKELLLATANYLQNVVYDRYFKMDHFTGYERIRSFFRVYLHIFEVEPSYYRFVHSFDMYGDLESRAGMTVFSDGLDRFYHKYREAYDEGVRSGTVSPVDDPELFYYASTHAVLELCKKLAAGKPVVRQDHERNPVREVETLVNLILDRLKGPAYREKEKSKGPF